MFIDYNQNARDKSVSSAYGVRPTGFVSAPITWDELATVAIEDFPARHIPRPVPRRSEIGRRESTRRREGSTPSSSGWQRDEDNGIGDAPWPPHYPKMPGEPPRVQPSRQRRPDDEY